MNTTPDLTTSANSGSAAGAAPGWFATTHWSLVVSAGRCSDPDKARAAIQSLCESYWQPLYSYVRRRGYSPDDAQDLTQEFFARLLENNRFARADQSRGKFRSFLSLFRDEDRQVRYNAVYFGLSTVRHKSDDVIRRLLELAMEDREHNNYSRISWGLRGDKEAVKRLLGEYTQSNNPTVATHAREIYQDMTGEPPPKADLFK